MSDHAAPTPIDRAPIDTAPKPPRSALARWWDRRGFVNCLRWGAIIAFIGAWEGASLAGWLDPLFASSPSLILEKLWDMVADGSIWPHVLASANIAASDLRRCRFMEQPRRENSETDPTKLFPSLSAIVPGTGT